MNKQFHASIKTDFSALQQLCADANAFLQSCDLPADPVYRIELALEEMVTNVIKYGYDVPGPNYVDVDLAVEHSAIVLTIEDCGHEFNPLLAGSPKLDENLDVRPIGGVGIHLTRSMVAHMAYERVGNLNRLSVKVNLTDHS